MRNRFGDFSLEEKHTWGLYEVKVELVLKEILERIPCNSWWEQQKAYC